MAVNGQHLAIVGRSLFGDQWQRALARALKVGEREVRRWKAGHRPIPVDLDVRLMRLLEERIHLLQDVREMLGEQSPALSVIDYVHCDERHITTTARTGGYRS